MFTPSHLPRAAETGLAAAETVLHRLPILWWQLAWPSASGRAEISRMVAEKQQAAIAGAFAAQRQLIEEAVTMGFLDPFAAWRRVLTAALRPAARTTRANARRLRRR